MAIRNYPLHALSDALVVPQKIKDENAGSPMNRLLVADALGIKPASSNFKTLLSSSRSYGLTEGTEKATDISLTPLGAKISANPGTPPVEHRRAAVMNVQLFKDFFERFNGNKLPSPEMMKKLLVADFGVPDERAEEAAERIQENGEFIGVIREISGSPHVLLQSSGDSGPDVGAETDQADAQGGEDVGVEQADPIEADADPDNAEHTAQDPSPRARPIFIGHGGKTGPLEKLEKVLSGFQIPFKVAISEPNLGRPIPQKVRDLMLECGSAILIFTKDQKLHDTEGNEIWRPSENVGHELGACSFAYEDRVVIFKEKGITLPSNFSSIGYIEFEEDGIEAKTADLLRELIGFGLVKVTPAG